MAASWAFVTIPKVSPTTAPSRPARGFEWAEASAHGRMVPAQARRHSGGLPSEPSLQSPRRQGSVNPSRRSCRLTPDLGPLFVEVLALCAEAGLVSVGEIAVDGTKMRASASYDRNRGYESVVEEILEQAEQADREEDERDGEAVGQVHRGAAASASSAGMSSGVGSSFQLSANAIVVP
jgi:hypothetical protein